MKTEGPMVGRKLLNMPPTYNNCDPCHQPVTTMEAVLSGSTVRNNSFIKFTRPRASSQLRSEGRGSSFTGTLPATPPEDDDRAPKDLFPGEEHLQKLEENDREWLRNRQEERRRQDVEDRQEYETRLATRRQQFEMTQSGDESPLITDDDRNQFHILIGVDKKKSDEHNGGLIRAVYNNSHHANKIYLLNVFQKQAINRADEANSYLEGVKLQLTQLRPEVSCEIAATQAKDKAGTILDYAEEKRVQLVILGMEDREKKAIFDKKTSPGVVDSLPGGKAVLLVPPPNWMNGVDQTSPINRVILVCHDDTETCTSTLVYLAHILKPQDRVMLFTAVTPPPRLVGVQQSNDCSSLQPNPNFAVNLQTKIETAQRSLQVARQKLLATMPELPNGNVDSAFRILDPEKNTQGPVVLEVADEVGASMIVLSTGGVEGWQKVLQGAVNNAVSDPNENIARCVLLVR
ncbi:hypothetical protein DIPPA_20958 [Diplonema papillatum]|nr:hypothetical protein DIPPA_20958 [Diplonema papillatum]